MSEGGVAEGRTGGGGVLKRFRARKRGVTTSKPQREEPRVRVSDLAASVVSRAAVVFYRCC